MPLQPGDGGLQQEQVLEHPAGQRDRAQAVALAQQQAAVGDQAGDAVVEARRDHPWRGAGGQVLDDGPDQVMPGDPERLRAA